MLNPLAAETRIRLALDALVAASEPPPEELREVIADGARLSPVDARFYSLLGMIEVRDGNREVASHLFDHALTLLPTEIQALTHKLAYDIEDGDFLAAVERVEILGRRWREHWPLVEPVLPVLLADERTFEHLVERFGREAGLRTMLVRSLASEPETLSFAYQVLVQWHAVGAPEIDGLINLVTGRLIAEKRYVDAFLLFRLTRPPEAERENGYVYNGNFRLEPSGNPFDWQLKSQAGVAFDIVRRPADPGATGPGEGDDGDRQLVMRFLNNPIQLRNVTQYTRLAPGEYRLELSYSVRNLTAPKPLLLAVRCIDSGAAVATLELESGTTESIETTAVNFSVPPFDCELQLLYIFNEPMPMSWRNRYAGSVTIDRIAISRIGAQQ